MKTVFFEYDPINVRWMGYHTELKKFFEGVAGLPNMPSGDKNMKVVYATPSSAFTKHVIPMLNGLTQYPILTFHLSSEETSREIGGSALRTYNDYKMKVENEYFRTNDTEIVNGKKYYVLSNGIYSEAANPTEENIGEYFEMKVNRSVDKYTYSQPLVKRLTYSCTLYTTLMSDCDYILTLLELNSNANKPYACKVNNRNAEYYIDDVEVGNSVSYEGKKYISCQFKVNVPWAVIAPTEIETDQGIIEKITTYLSGESVVVE